MNDGGEHEPTPLSKLHKSIKAMPYFRISVGKGESMILVAWQGKGAWIPIIVAIACFTPILVLRQIDGPAVDHGVGITMGLAAIITFILGLRLNSGLPKGEPAPHAFCSVPFQYWAVPMLVFAILLGTRTITTEEPPPPHTGPVMVDPSDSDANAIV